MMLVPFIWMGGGFVLPMQKSEGVLSGGGLSEGVLSEGFCPEGVLSYIPNPQMGHGYICTCFATV